PVVFVANNNQWAISVPLKLQTASETLAQKAIAAGFAGEQVDGNDVIATRAAADEAIARARAGGGPRLIEAMTYRLSDHTTADDAARYRPPEEVQARWKEEPIARLRAYLVSQKAWGKAQEEELAAECQKQIEAAIEHYLATSPRAPETMFDHLYAELPGVYAGQRAELAGGSDACGYAGRRHQPGARPRHGRGCHRGRARGGRRRQWRRLSCHRRAAAAFRRRAGDRHAARGAPDQRALRRHGGARVASRRRNPVPWLHLSLPPSAGESRLAGAHPNPGAAELPHGAAHAARWRHPRARTPFGEHRGDARAYPGAAGRHPVLAGTCLWAFACRHPRSRSGGVSRADAHLSRGEGASGG